MSNDWIRDAIVAKANEAVGLDADPADPVSRRAYLDLIAPGETSSTRAEMALMSGCGLVVAGLWRNAGVDDDRLDPPYRIGSAISRLIAIAHTAGAWVQYSADATPDAGDMVLVGDDGAGGTTHVYTVTAVSTDEQGVVTLESVDGGQRDVKGYETVTARTRTWEPRNGGVRDVVGSSARVIVGWIDCTQLPAQPQSRGALRAPAAAKPPGRPGADSSVPVTHTIGGKMVLDLATAAFGAPPVFWGRYFTSTATTNSVEYHHATENAALAAAGIPVLPIARQTNRVGGSQAGGEADGLANAKDFLATFGEAYLLSKGGEFVMFLDVEGSPSLSSDYYVGWTRGLAALESDVVIHPCVYATQYDSKTWGALGAAGTAGAPCKGLWIAHWTHVGFHAPEGWSDVDSTPVPHVPFPVLIWQYANDAFGSSGFDCSQTNPDRENELLPFLVIPPSPA